MDKIACPHCGEQNYPNSKLCWACGKPLTAPPVAPPVAAPAEPTPPAPPSVAEPALAPPPDPPAAPEQAEDGLKPAEREARALREKEFVTPPVDLDETPHTLGGWIAYGGAAIAGSGQAFREALDDYDRRRGRSTGAMSSFGCLVVILVLVVLAAIFYYLFPLVALRS
ncbi:MAG TPA: zinc ribbon domain-containing protein [Armatimonadota bacterium]|jgi:predicted nucleic acid-binding Zn ribbon protein